MLNLIKQRTTYLFNQKNVKKYHFTLLGLTRFGKLKPRSQELFIELLQLIGNDSSIDSIIIKATYKELGFKYTANFSKYRKDLLDSDLLFYRDNKYFVNPALIDYYSRRQREYFFKLFKLKKEPIVTMTQPKVIRMV